MSLLPLNWHSLPLAEIAAESRPLTQGPDLTRYLLVCLGVLAFVIAIGFGFRKLVAGHLKARASARSLRIIDLLPLGAKRQLSVVRCYDRTFLLALGEKEVRLIAELEQEVPNKEDPAPSNQSDMADFARILEASRSKLIPRRQAPTGPGQAKLGEVIG